jgi:hypothetical protein
MRYYIAPDTEYNSGLYCVFDSQERNQWGEQKCVLTYVPQAIAQKECDRLNGLEIARAVLTKMVDPTADVSVPSGIEVHVHYGKE